MTEQILEIPSPTKKIIQKDFIHKIEKKWDTISVEDINKLWDGVEKFYKERNYPRLNIVWLADTFLKRLKNDNDYWVNVEGRKGCLSSDTEIFTQDGIKKISELKNKINKLKCYDFKNNEIIYSESLLIDSGEKEVYEIEFVNGDKIKATLDHTFFVLRNNKLLELKLKNIKEGNELLCSNI